MSTPFSTTITQPAVMLVLKGFWHAYFLFHVSAITNQSLCQYVFHSSETTIDQCFPDWFSVHPMFYPHVIGNNKGNSIGTLHSYPDNTYAYEHNWAVESKNQEIYWKICSRIFDIVYWRLFYSISKIIQAYIPFLHSQKNRFDQPVA